MQSAAKMLRRHVSPVFFAQPNVPNPTFSNVLTFSPAQLAYCTASVITSQATLNYAVAPFMLLSSCARRLPDGRLSTSFYGHILTSSRSWRSRTAWARRWTRRGGRAKLAKRAGKGVDEKPAAWRPDDYGRRERCGGYENMTRNGGKKLLEKQAEDVTTLAPEPIS